MGEPQQSDVTEPGEQPGKTRTLWHPLLARLLDFALSSAYTVTPEVHVGKMPLRVDILLVRREGGELPEAKRREVPALLPLLNHFTLIEFKGPTDALARGDFAQLAGCAFLWHSQQIEAIPQDEVSLVILAPAVNAAIREELRLLKCEVRHYESGIFRVTGLPFVVWMVETDVMAGSLEPILSLVSRVFLQRHRSIIEELTLAGHAGLTWYAMQLVHQLHVHREEFAVQTGVVDAFAELDEKLVRDFLETLPADWRVRGLPPEERLRGLPQDQWVSSIPPEERVRGLPPEERLRGLSLEERLAGLSEEEKAQIVKLLMRNRSN